MARDNDGIILIKFANAGDVGLGGLDLNELWPISYSTPGGQEPQRIQFNQLFRFLSALGVEINDQGPYLEYNATINYKVNAGVIGSDGAFYRALAVNGPGSSVVSPIGNPDTWKNIFSSASAISKIQSVSAVAAANELTLTFSGKTLDFRSVTLPSGDVVTRELTDPISLVITNGSTLGAIDAIQARIAIIVIDNNGTLELATVNLAGGNNLDESDLISTIAEGGAGGADLNNVIYSDSARSNVAYRVVGYIDSTQATAGIYVTPPSTVQGQGGQAFSAMSSIGYGQNWVDVTGSRAVDIFYHNTTGKPIAIHVTGNATGASFVNISVNGVFMLGHEGQSGEIISNNAIIPVGASYGVNIINGTLNQWMEMR